MSPLVALTLLLATVSASPKKNPFPEVLLPFLAAGGSGADPLPPHIDPNIGMSNMKFHEMPIEASFSGPLATLGVLAIISSAFMAASYFQAANAQRRSGYAGQYIHKRSTFDIDPDAIVSRINSFR